jgi:hypothetical protein
MQKREGKSVIETCNLCWAFKVWWESMPQFTTTEPRTSKREYSSNEQWCARIYTALNGGLGSNDDTSCPGYNISAAAMMSYINNRIHEQSAHPISDQQAHGIKEEAHSVVSAAPP